MINLKDEISNYSYFLKSIPHVMKNFEVLFKNVSRLEDIENGFSQYLGDITLAKSLIKDIFPYNFYDD
jgi:hypothetical protein